MQTRLTNLCKGAGEHLDLGPIQSGVGCHLDFIWGPKAPFQLASPSGMRVVAWYRANVGPPDAFFAGTAMDLGDEVVLQSGDIIPNLCPIKAIAGSLVSARPRSHIPEFSPDVYLWWRVVQDVCSIPRESLKRNPGSRTTDLVCQMGEGRGLPDSFLAMCRRALPGHHLLSICQDPKDPSAFVFRLGVIHSALEGEVHFTPKTANKLLKWVFDSNNQLVECTPVIVICPVMIGNDRHSLNLRTKKTTFREVREHLAQIVQFGKVKVVAYRQGCWEALLRQPGSRLHSAEEIDCKMDKLESQLVECGVDNSADGAEDGYTCAMPEPFFTSVNGLDEDPRSNARGDDFDECAWEEVGRILRAADGAETNTAMCKLFEEQVKPQADAVDAKDDGGMLSALLVTGRFFNCWIKRLITAGELPSQAKETIVETLRSNWFDGTAREGPSWNDIAAEFTGKIPSGQLKLLKEMVLFGADPVYLGPKKGYIAKPYPGTQDVEILVLWDYLALLNAKRAVIFDVEEEGMAAILVDAGVHITPIVGAQKKEADGTLKFEYWEGEDGQLLSDPVMRICNDCTNGGDSHAPNTGLRSSQHSTQKTTSPQLVAYKALKEERKHPECELRVAKDDVQKAFNLLAYILKHVGLVATRARRFACVNLNLAFGPAVSPGDFEVPGDALVKALMFTNRGDTTRTGELHPEVARWVDDLVSLIAQCGDRAPDHLKRLRLLLTTLLGEKAHNLIKQGKEGEPENF